MSNPITTHGLNAVPASHSALLSGTPEHPAPPHPAPPFTVSDTPVPYTPLAKRIQGYAHSRLPEQTYNHSMRVYHYGLAIKHYRFPSWSFSDETYFLACMLHDIGTTDENLRKTKLSFEFQGGMEAMEVLSTGEAVAELEQAESVAEAIIRHQDLCEVGKITSLGMLVQLATVFDNMGSYENLVHPSTIENVVAQFPRLKWASCFAATLRKEMNLKPWAHTTAMGEEKFPADVEGNKLMAKYE
ncbi:hypothetical protein AJ79_07922 [Helicocarpus griseus UAMH5409]|uniref:HD/PDEase domain-containing protein n=1 Tax=Helicocarpus griseus UAMH5409 TaxID=1447875 RepID=A0A2B7WQ40_9EURO|nr:hypothetical protein AJ79_07922 [Helicocarpus griseus UAMH5409]